jgi:hypothetical protein
LSRLTTNQKGAVAELAIACAAAKAGVGVLRPVCDERYDLVFDLRGRFIRVQCKTAVRRGEVVVVRCRTCRRSADGLVRGTYSSDEIDAFAAFCPELDRSFFLPLDQISARTAIQLRLATSRNNQRERVNWADDYDFERLDWARFLGP